MSENLIENKNFAKTNLGDVCILGLGKTGIALANYLSKELDVRVKSLHVFAGEQNEFTMKAADKLLKKGINVSFKDDIVNEKFDLCISSPGISEFSSLVQSAKENCTEVISEIEFAWRESEKSDCWIAVTGTNGKTTTTSLITHILNSSKFRSISVGNIGNVAIDAVEKNLHKSRYEHVNVYVAEVSSYQLALCDKFAPKVAILLNITPDHIDWHDGFENYKKAKLKVFNNAEIGVLNFEDKEINNCFKSSDYPKMQIIKNYTDSENIKLTFNGEEHKIINIDNLKILGEHNCANARAAASACVALGVDDKKIAEALASFKSLEHRLEPCGIIAGVRLFNDSKATNVDSTIVAIKSFPKKKAIFIMGGRDKNTNLDALVEDSLQNLKGVVCYGEAGQRFYDAFKDKCNIDDFILEKQQNMGMAFKWAMENAYPGDYVVLSPACSSFDEFKSFEERGTVFKSLVNKCK